MLFYVTATVPPKGGEKKARVWRYAVVAATKDEAEEKIAPRHQYQPGTVFHADPVEDGWVHIAITTA